MDFGDLGSAFEEADRERALAKVRSVGVVLQSAVICVECGCEIPERRREVLPGVQQCVDCASIGEFQQKQRAR